MIKSTIPPSWDLPLPGLPPYLVKHPAVASCDGCALPSAPGRFRDRLLESLTSPVSHIVFHPVCGVSRGPYLYNGPLVREPGSRMFQYNTAVAWFSYSWRTLKSQTVIKVGGIYRRVKALLTVLPKHGSTHDYESQGERGVKSQRESDFTFTDFFGTD